VTIERKKIKKSYDMKRVPVRYFVHHHNITKRFSEL
jgi:hypothetical protein